MEYKIYNQNGDVKAEFSASDNSTHENSVMGDNVLNLSFTLFEFVKLAVNDYVEFEGERYKLMEPYRPTMKSSIEYEYNCSFHGTVGDCKKGIVLKLVDGENNPTFSLTDTAAVHLQLIVDNINRIKGSLDWSVGQVVDGGIKDIVYENTYCFDALTKLAEAFDTEWWIEGSTINLSRCEHGAPVELGYNKGLVDLGKDDNTNARFFTRLLPVGSTRNIDPAVYGHKRLQLPGGVKFVEQNIEYGIVEQSEEEAFAHIYPKRIGKVGVVREFPTKIEGVDRVIYYFTDPSMTFNPNDYDISGLVKNIVFQSGDLNGRDFEVNFDNITKEFEIILQYPYDNQQLPGGSLIPKHNDEYILYNLRMPTEYYPLAEDEFKVAVDDFLQKYSIDTAIYKAQNDYVWFMENEVHLKVGSRIRLLSDEYFDIGYMDSRVVRIARNINNPFIMNIEFSNAVSKGRIESIENNVVNIQAAFNEQLNKDVLQVLKSWDSADESEYNVFSAIRALKTINKMALRKDIPDTAAEEIRFKKGLFSSDFRRGDFSGAGYGAYADQHGNSVIEVDKMVVRKEAVFNEIIINQINFQGGKVVYSAACMECVAVDGWKCHFDTKNGQMVNQFVVGDQVRCQRFGGGTVIKYYMSIIDAVGEDYIELSSVDIDGVDEPEVGDIIVQFGHRSDSDRQALIEIDVLGGGKQTFFEGINSYNLSDRDSITMGVCGVNENRKTQIRCFGEFYVGARDMSQYVQWNGSQLQINGKLVAGSSGLENFIEWKNKQQQIDNAQDTADNAGLVALEAIEAAVSADKKAADAVLVADAAKTRLDVWAADSSISPTEKRAINDERIALANEKESILADATRYETVSEEGVSDIPTLQYVVAWTQYDVELSYHCTAEPENITIRAELELAQTSYYAEKQSLLNLIAEASKQYVMSQSYGSMEDIAKNLGYGSYAGMITNAISKPLTIVGGYLNAELIDTDTLFAKNIATKPVSESDKRHIEITSASNSMIMYDVQNVPRLVVHGANYQSIEEITGIAPIDSASFKSASFELEWKYPEDVGYKRKWEEISLCTFIIDSDDSYTMTIPPLRLKNTGTTTGKIDYFYLNLPITIRLYKDDNYSPVLYYNGLYWEGGAINEVITQPIMIHELTRGSYNIKIEYSGTLFVDGYPAQSPNPGPGIKLVSAISLADLSGNVTIAGLAQVTKMFANGFASTWSSNKYFSVINKDAVGSDLINAQGFMRFMSENGVFGLRQTDNGLLQTDNGADKNPQWYGMMPGLVHAGVVNNGYPARRWSAPGAGYWTSQKNNNIVGNYLVSFYETPFTGDDYTVLLTNTFGRKFASLVSRSSTGFNVLTADGANQNDSNFCFFVFNIKKWPQ